MIPGIPSIRELSASKNCAPTIFTRVPMSAPPLNLAKRLISLPELKHPSPIAGAFGMLLTEANFENTFAVRSAWITVAGKGSDVWKSNFTHDFEGVGLSRVTTFGRSAERDATQSRA